MRQNILKLKVHPYSWFSGCSDTGWITNGLFGLYLGFFAFSFAKNSLNFFRFFAKKQLQKSAKKILLKTTAFERQITDILQESPKVCPIPKSVSLKNASSFKSHNLPLLFYVSTKTKTHPKNTNYCQFMVQNIFRIFSHFREKLYFSFVFREKSKMRKNAEVYSNCILVLQLTRKKRCFLKTAAA